MGLTRQLGVKFNRTSQNGVTMTTAPMTSSAGQDPMKTFPEDRQISIQAVCGNVHDIWNSSESAADTTSAVAAVESDWQNTEDEKSIVAADYNQTDQNSLSENDGEKKPVTVIDDQFYF